MPQQLLHRFICLTGTLTLVLLAACGGNKAEDDEPVNAGFVRLVNASAGPLDLYDGTTAIGAAGANGSTAYIDRRPEAHDFKIKLGGTSTQVAALSTGVGRQERYTLVAARNGNTYSTAVLTDNESAPSSGAKFRVYNAAAADVGSLDVYLVSAPTCTGLAAPIAGSVSGLAGYTVVSAGVAYRVCVTGQGDAADLRLELPAAAFSNQQIVTLVLARGLGGTLVDGLLVTQRGAVGSAANPSARVRLVADTTTGSGVVASANGRSLGSLATAPAVGGYVLVPAGTLNVQATVGATASTLTPSASATGGGDYTLLLTGTEAAPAATLIADDNTPSTSSANPVKLRLVNGLNGVAGSASFSYESAVVASAAFGTASTPALRPLTVGAPTITATFGATTVPVAASNPLVAGKVYTVFLLGSLAAPVTKLQPDR
jgi:hypothetical protein